MRLSEAVERVRLFALAKRRGERGPEGHSNQDSAKTAGDVADRIWEMPSWRRINDRTCKVGEMAEAGDSQIEPATPIANHPHADSRRDHCGEQQDKRQARDASRDIRSGVRYLVVLMGDGQGKNREHCR